MTRAKHPRAPPPPPPSYAMLTQPLACEGSHKSARVWGSEEPLVWTPPSLKCLRPKALLARAASRLSPRSDDSFWQRTLGSLQKSPNKAFSAQTPGFFPLISSPRSLPSFFPHLLSKQSQTRKQTAAWPARPPDLNFSPLPPHLGNRCPGACRRTDRTLSAFLSGEKREVCRSCSGGRKTSRKRASKFKDGPQPANGGSPS